MNILLTNECNRRCPYCFAGERISYSRSDDQERAPGAPKFIAQEDYEQALEFAARSGLKRISLLGGEPSIHPEFPRLVELAWERGLHVTIFTNGIWPEPALRFLEGAVGQEKRAINLTVNINDPGETPEWQTKAQDRLFQRVGRQASLSFNIYCEDFDPSFLVDTILSHNLRKNIRLGIAAPLARQESNHVAIDRYDLLAPAIMDLASRCDEHDIRLGFDCGFLFCMFDTHQLGLLQTYGANFKSSCGPAVDVGTDLTVWSCFPLSTFSKGVFLREFENIDRLGEHFNRHFERLFKTGALEKCVDCKYRRRGQCSGGCAAHVYRKMNP